MNTNHFLGRSVSIRFVLHSVLAVIIVSLTTFFVVAGLVSGHGWRGYPFMWSAQLTAIIEAFIAIRLLGDDRLDKVRHSKAAKAITRALLATGILLFLWALMALWPCR